MSVNSNLFIKSGVSVQMISKSELMHHRLQAWLREYKSDDIEYLGFHNDNYWYRVGTHEVPVDFIEGLEEVKK